MAASNTVLQTLVDEDKRGRVMAFYTMAFFGLHMLDDLYHNKLSHLDTDWSRDSFSPIPAFVDTGSVLIDKSNVAAFQESSKSAKGK